MRPAVDVYVGDERLVPPDDAAANQRLIREALLDRVGGAGSFSPMPTTGRLEECVADYQRTIAALLGGPGIDLIHLGMGPDGHTASLFPGVPELEAGPGVFVAATTDPNGRNPHPRLTLTLPAINARVRRCSPFRVHRRRMLSPPCSGGTTSRRAGSTRPGRSGWWMPPHSVLPPRLTSMLSDADLINLPLPDLTALARGVRDEAHGGA